MIVVEIRVCSSEKTLSRQNDNADRQHVVVENYLGRCCVLSRSRRVSLRAMLGTAKYHDPEVDPS